MERIQYTYFGLDLGQRNDYSAIAVIDLVEDISAQRDPVTFEFYRTHKFCLRGVHRFKVLAWIDHLTSLAHGTLRKEAAGQDVSSELLQAAALLDADADGATTTASEAELLRAAAARLPST